MTTRTDYNREAMQKWRADPVNRTKEKLRRDREGERRKTLKRRLDPTKWGSTVLCNIRFRAKNLGLPCTITANDLIVPELCPVLGFPLVLTAGDYQGPRMNFNSPSVDRFENTKGYTPDNVRVISLRANMLKSNATVEELRAVLRYMEGQ